MYHWSAGTAVSRIANILNAIGCALIAEAAMYNCPVCGYDKLESPPRHFSICACCGTEFGASDRILTHEQLREKWIDSGYIWFDSDDPPSKDWSPFEQLENAGFSRAARVDEIYIFRIGEPVSIVIPTIDSTANSGELKAVA